MYEEYKVNRDTPY